MPRRPPKPADRPPSPRHKSRKAGSTRSAIEALNRLTDEQPTYDHFSEFIAETNAEKNDRGAAILLATNVENALQIALLRMFKTRKDQARGLFGSNSPLGTFANKIQMAYALDIFGDETKANLDIIRTVRNAFAHAKIPIKFETPQVKNACAHLHIPTLLPPHTVRPPQERIEGRKRFQTVCNDVAHNLNVFGRRALTLIDPKVHQLQLPANFEIFAKHTALP